MNDDLIKRSDALKVAYRYCPDDDGSCSCADRDLREMLNDMEDIPSADRPQGEWIDKGDYAVCSNCGTHSGTQFDGVEPVPRKTNFCPNCGARMKGADDGTR